MKLGLLRPTVDVGRAIWLALPFAARASLRGASPETVSLDDVRRAHPPTIATTSQETQ